MLMNTHMLLANNILSRSNGKKVYLINKNRFLWGNVKPDCASKYKLKKHYYEESIEMILEKIYFLSSFSINDIYYNYGKKKFSEELGVVCHFLCDFFCMPHNRRMEFKNAIDMKNHVIYENKLAKAAKSYTPKDEMHRNLSVDMVEIFITKNLEKYEKDKGFENDLDFSYYVCNSVVNLILEQVSQNEYARSRRAS